jgi:hypothetical protein
MDDTRINRRNFCTIAGGAVASLALSTACRRSWANLPNDGRFTARPKSGTGVPPVDHAQDARATPLGSSTVGRQTYLGLDRDRDAILQLNHILPIDRCGRRIAADLKARGYQVSFREFDGDHEIPADVIREGLRWVAKS